MKNTLKIIIVIAALIVLIIFALSSRYQMIAQNVAGAAGANEFSTPETIRGYVYVLDKWSGSVYIIDGYKKSKVIRT